MGRKEMVATLNTQNAILFDMERVLKLFIVAIVALSPLTIPLWGLKIPISIGIFLLFLVYIHYIFVGMISLRLVFQKMLNKFNIILPSKLSPYSETILQLFIILIPPLILAIVWWQNSGIDPNNIYILSLFVLASIPFYFLPWFVPLSDIDCVKERWWGYGGLGIPKWVIEWRESPKIRWFKLFTTSIELITTCVLTGVILTPFTLIFLYLVLGDEGAVKDLIRVFSWPRLIAMIVLAGLLVFHLRKRK
jgi:hypothetical protein